MLIAWTKHIKDETEKVEFEKYIKGSKRLLDRLKEIVDEEEQSLNRSETDIKTFDQPNWENRQAYKNGYRACLNIMKKLVNVDQNKGN